MAKLLSGGNPQIPMGYGDAVVQAYIAAVPGWKRVVCRQIDQIVSSTAPGLCKAVKWNSPFYGIERDCWFLSVHCFERYVKISFFNGAELDPPPAEKSKHPLVRYHHVPEGEAIDEAQFSDWVKQASKLPGEKM